MVSANYGPVHSTVSTVGKSKLIHYIIFCVHARRHALIIVSAIISLANSSAVSVSPFPRQCAACAAIQFVAWHGMMEAILLDLSFC